MNARILVCALLLVSSPAAAQLGTPLEVAESNSKSCGEMTDHAAAPTRFATVSASALVESRSARNVTEIGADVSTRDYYENYRVLGGDEGATGAKRAPASVSRLAAGTCTKAQRHSGRCVSP